MSLDVDYFNHIRDFNSRHRHCLRRAQHHPSMLPTQPPGQLGWGGGGFSSFLLRACRLGHSIYCLAPRISDILKKLFEILATLKISHSIP